MDENSGLPGTDDRTGQGSRRALLAAGTTAALGAVGVALARPAEAAAGQALLLGRSNTSGSSATAVSSSTTGTAFGVTATAGHGLVGIARANSKFGHIARNDATTTGTGGALLGDGKANAGVVGRTANRNAYGIAGFNTGTAGGNSGAVLANGGSNVGLAAFTAAPAGVNAAPAIFADGGLGAWASWLIGDQVVDGFLFASRNLVGVQEPGNVITYRTVVSGESAQHVESGRVTLDLSGAGTVVLPAGYLAATSLGADTSVQLTAMGTAMPNLAATLTTTGFTVSGGVSGGSVSWTVSSPRSQTPIAAGGAPVAAAARADAGSRTRPRGTAPRRADAGSFTG